MRTLPLVSKQRSITGATIAGILALVVLAVPIVLFAFLGLISWSGGWLLDYSPPNRRESVLMFALAGLLIVDVMLWAWAGLRGFPVLLSTVAAIPPTVLGLVYVIGVLSGAY